MGDERPIELNRGETRKNLHRLCATPISLMSVGDDLKGLVTALVPVFGAIQEGHN